MVKEDYTLNQISVDEGIQKILSQLINFEIKYGKSSKHFYEEYLTGEIEDSRDFFLWASKIEVYCRRKKIDYSSLPSKVGMMN